MISSITSKDNYYLDKLFELDESIQTHYLNIIEKYIEVGSGGTTAKDKNNATFKSTLGEKGANHLFDIEQKYDHLNQKFNEMEKEYMELNLKHKDAIMEIGYLKSKNTMNMEVQEEMIKDTILTNQLKSDLEAKENEIDDLKRDYELLLERSNEEKVKLKVF